MYLPQGFTYSWDVLMVYSQAISSGIRAISFLFIFLGISHMLIYSVAGRYDPRLNRSFLSIALCFLFSAFASLIDIVVIWEPLYVVQVSVRCIAALIAAWAAFYELPIVPELLENVFRRMRGLETDRATLLRSIDNQASFLSDDFRSLSRINSEGLQPFVQKLQELTTDIRTLLHSQEKASGK